MRENKRMMIERKRIIRITTLRAIIKRRIKIIRMTIKMEIKIIQLIQE